MWRCIVQRCNNTPHLSPPPAACTLRPDCLREPVACALLTTDSGASSITIATTTAAAAYVATAKPTHMPHRTVAVHTG
jgi:hypothetical protein